MTYPHTGPPGTYVSAPLNVYSFCGRMLSAIVLLVALLSTTTALAAAPPLPASTHVRSITDRAISSWAHDKAVTATNASPTSGHQKTGVAGLAGGPQHPTSAFNELAWGSFSHSPKLALDLHGQRWNQDENCGTCGTPASNAGPSHVVDQAVLEAAHRDRVGGLAALVLALLLSYLIGTARTGRAFMTAEASKQGLRYSVWCDADHVPGPLRSRASGRAIYMQPTAWRAHSVSPTGGC